MSAGADSSAFGSRLAMIKGILRTTVSGNPTRNGVRCLAQTLELQNDGDEGLTLAACWITALRTEPSLHSNLKGCEMVRQLVRLSRLAIPLALVGLGPSSAAVGESYPSGMIRIVTGGAVGSPSDIIIRIVANELGPSEDWRIVVENKPGGLGTIADGEVLKQPADGHTIRAIGITNSVYPALHPNIGYRLDTDFA